MSKFGAALTYSEVEGLIFIKVREFVRKYGKFGVTTDEAKSDAYFGFMVAYRTYRPDVAEFTTWVGFKVWKAMLSGLRAKLKAAAREGDPDDDLEDIPAPPEPAFRVPEFLEDLSADAAAVVTLVLDEPAHFRVNLARVGGPKSPVNVRAAARECLFDAGRTARQVQSVFAEIRQAL